MVDYELDQGGDIALKSANLLIHFRDLLRVKARGDKHIEEPNKEANRKPPLHPCGWLPKPAYEVVAICGPDHLALVFDGMAPEADFFNHVQRIFSINRGEEARTCGGNSFLRIHFVEYEIALLVSSSCVMP